ncbi:hypothetical protein [Mucilaginibacter sp. CSA2-8R]|uniref:hypothetical protein n=1 Tax=Mucilaginibacter sp. CSA2-8R TaxID=3141542 RepID=UPI00315CD135
MKRYLYLMLSCMVGLTACSNHNSDDARVAAPVATEAPRVMAPFRYHKTVEVAPGQYYDVLSWGRGSESTGAFEILRSDSATMKYTTTTGDLDGRIVDVFNSDMDTDGNPEIFIHTQAADSTNAAQVIAFEYNDNTARKLEFPRLTKSQRKGYRGNDRFFIKDGNLTREFEVFDDADSLTKTPLQKRLIEYNLRGNNLQAKQLSTDSVTKEATTPRAAKLESETKSSSSNSHSSSKKSSSKKSVKKSRSSRHHESHHKRRRHRR